MSAFVVDSDCISRVVFLCAMDDPPYIPDGGITTPPDLVSKHAQQDLTEVGRELLALNYRSVKARYGDAAGAPPRRCKYYVFELGHAAGKPAVQLVKSACCWMYQACESEEVRESRLFKHVQNRTNWLCSLIVKSTPEFGKALWG